jgi:hypothetical protein
MPISPSNASFKKVRCCANVCVSRSLLGLFFGPRITGAGHYISSTGGGGDFNHISPDVRCLTLLVLIYSFFLALCIYFIYSFIHLYYFILFSLIPFILILLLMSIVRLLQFSIVSKKGVAVQMV